MKPTPSDWPRISSALFYVDAKRAIDFIVRAFGFEVRLKHEGKDGRIEHSELWYGNGPHEGLIMVGSVGKGSERPRDWAKSPAQLGGANQALCIFVDDVDAHCARARNAGAIIEEGPKTSDYGPEFWSDRSYLAVDPEGHRWWFMQRLRSKGD
jgi:uncharacterized glyoxalase superfamily protein PhnB